MNRKSVKVIMVTLIITLLLFTVDVNAAEALNFCERKGILQVFRIIGSVKNILKILVPILLIIMTTIDFGKVALSGDDKDMANAKSMAIKRVIAGIIIFFIPTIVDAVLKQVSAYDADDYYNNSGTGTFGKCSYCFASPSKENCENRASK